LPERETRGDGRQSRLPNANIVPPGVRRWENATKGYLRRGKQKIGKRRGEERISRKVR